MATKYPKKRSPYWSVQFFDEDGIRRNQSSGLRRDSPTDTAAADILVAELTAAEVKRGLSGTKQLAGWDFVTKYLADHCLGRANTHQSYLNRWGWISLFLAEKKIRSPEQIQFIHGQEYVDWRTGRKKKSGKTVCRNTAILETKLLSQVVQAAVQRGLCQTNSLIRTGLRKDEVAEKPEITDEEFTTIGAALKTEPEWMRVSWEIAKHTGCRLKDTSIPMAHLDFAEDRIFFGSPKGGAQAGLFCPLAKGDQAGSAVLARRAKIDGDFSISTFSPMAAFLPTCELAAPYISLHPCYLRNPARAARSAARRGNAVGKPCVEADP